MTIEFERILIRQRNDARCEAAQALEVLAWLERELAKKDRELEAMAQLAAEQTLLKEELAARCAWYRSVLGEFGSSDAVGVARAKLQTGHRLNGESAGTVAFVRQQQAGGR